MTKTSIFGQSEVKQEEKKPIEFVKYLSISKEKFGEAVRKPNIWENVILLEKDYTCNFDLMWAYDSNPNCGCLYLGHWNDGIT